MKRRHWLWIAICAMLFLTMGMSDSQAFTKDENALPIVGNYLDMSESGIPTTTVTVDEVGMWITFTHDQDGEPFRFGGSSFTQNLITGDIWWSDIYKLVRWSSTGGMTTITSADFGFPDESIFVATDHEGNMWIDIGTGYPRDERPDGSLFRLALDGTVFDYSDKVGGVVGIEADRTGNLWFFESRYLTHYDGETWTTQYWYVPCPPHIIEEFYTDVLTTIGQGSGGHWSIESPERIWCPYNIDLQGPSVYDGTSWTLYSVEDGLLSQYSSRVIVDHQGHKWFSVVGEGLSVLDDNGTLSKDDDIWTNYIFDALGVVVDQEGKVWVGDHDDYGENPGVRVWDGQTWIKYTSNNSALPDKRLTPMFMDESGAIWFDTSDSSSDVNEVICLIQDLNRIFMPLVSNGLH